MTSAKQTAKKAQKNDLPATKNKKEGLPKEETVDHELVKEAYEKLNGIVREHIMMAMLEAGQYIIEKFYGDNYDNARKNKKVKIRSLNELINQFHENSGGSPSKTWIYDAVKLAVDNHDYKENSAYGKIGHSHKVALTHVKDEETKKKLIEETAKQQYSVVKLKERIRELKNAISLSELPSEEELRKLEPKKLNTIKKQIDWRLEKMEETLEKYKKSQATVESIINELDVTEAVADE